MKNREELLIRIIHFLAEHLKTEIALEGGMLLRLLNCPRSTQDVDYVLISDESKKVLAQRIRALIAKLDDVAIIGVTLNSRGIFIDVESADATPLRAAIEIKVQSELHLPLESVTTAAIAAPYLLEGRIVSTVALAEAFANKIAAALERRNARDLYDLTQFESIGPYDTATLRGRLATLSVQRSKPKASTFREAAAMLRDRIADLTEGNLKQELYPLIPPQQQPGLLLLIKAAVGRIAARLEVERENDEDQG